LPSSDTQRRPRRPRPAVCRRVTIQSRSPSNAEAQRRAPALEGDRLWIVARRQTAGRGRRGRLWVSEEGNLYATLLLRDPGPGERLGELCFVAGVALHEAVSAALRQAGAGGPDLRLKWPNDLLLGGAKLAGILIEGESGSRQGTVSIGFGVNCRHHPAVAGYPATDLASAGVEAAPEQLWPLLAEAADRWLMVWNRGGGFSVVRAAWLERAGGVGQPVTVRLPDRDLEGVFDALDERGHILLRLPSGAIRPIAAGEVFFSTGTPRP